VPKHPTQPLEMVNAILRFKQNKIVNALVEHGQKTGLSINDLARMSFTKEDWSQFAQLIGYSHSGASAYLTNDELDAAMRMYEHGETEDAARARVAECRVERLRHGMQDAIADLYDKHPDDLAVKPASQL
jgi:hypothetical protein